MSKPKPMSERERELKRRQQKIDKLERMTFGSEYPGEFIHVAKRIYDGILKRAFVTGIRSVGGSGGKVIIEYKPKNGRGSGVLELYDIGPQPN